MKRLFALLLCGTLMVPPGLAAPAADWPQWAEEALSWGRDASISRDLLAVPGKTVTRGMAAQLLYEAAGKPAVSGECPFTDVSGDNADAVTWAAERGYLTGVGDGRYEPGRSVTRQEFAAILWRRAGSPGAAVQGLDQFRDAGAVGEWARTPVLWALQAGVMAGQSGGRLAPSGTITVAEALVMLERVHTLPDVTRLRADLEALTAAHRPIGSQGEADAVQYLKGRFEAMGYTVTLQPYTDSQGRTGHNVVAV